MIISKFFKRYTLLLILTAVHPPECEKTPEFCLALSSNLFYYHYGLICIKKVFKDFLDAFFHINKDYL